MRLTVIGVVFIATGTVSSWGCQSAISDEPPQEIVSTDAYVDNEEIDQSQTEPNPDYGLDQTIACRPCPEGFETAQGCLCEDIDECSLSVCDGICTNTAGGFDCSPDADGDGVSDTTDNCPQDANAMQLDIDRDLAGDRCDDDDDNDGVSDVIELSLGTNPQQTDTDSDGVNDFYELQCRSIDSASQCPPTAPDTLATGVPDALNPDVDDDGHLDGEDNCFAIPNPRQLDTDSDGLGNLCDDDVDGDRVIGTLDCDDNNPNVGARVFDQDCDGSRELSRTIRSFSAGWQTTCGILESGYLRCFGVSEATPLMPPLQKDGSEYSDWIEVSAGNGMACAIHSNGRMDCFGHRAPEPPLDERGQPYADWYAVDVGGDSTPYACAIRLNGQLHCFGAHRAFETLIGELETGRDWVSVAIGVRHGCARSGDGRVMCFGEDNFGQGSPPVEYAGRWLEMDGGYAHTCGRIDSGEMICFGINSDDQLDVPRTENDGPIIDWKSVSVGGFAGCGIRDTDHILCWGSNYYGQTLIPETSLPWIGVGSGRYHTCGQRSDGSLHCWGWNSRGERDVPIDLVFRQAAPLDNCPGISNPDQSDMDLDERGDPCDHDRDGDGLSNVLEPTFGLDPDLIDTDGDGISDGIEFGCDPECPEQPTNTDAGSPIDALNTDSDADGEVDETDNCRVVPNPNQTDLDGDDIGNLCDSDIDGDGIRGEDDCDDFLLNFGLQTRDTDCDGVENRPLLTQNLLVTGGSITCIIDASGALVCAGQDHYEQTHVPTNVHGESYRDWVSVDVSFSHGCATRLNGELLCWGANYDGRGNPPPFDDSGLEISWGMVTTGFAHSCALSIDGRAFCFGSNYDGQCDVPQNPNTGMPYQFKSIDAGAFHNCGLTFDDQLVCFGSSNRLQRPISINQEQRFSQVASAREHSCALRLNGEMQCWSRIGFMDVPLDDNGQTITDWRHLTAGGYHTCAIRESGRVNCFGVDSDGQQGLVEIDRSFIAVAAGERYTCGVDDELNVHCVGLDSYGQVSGMHGRTVRESSGPDNCEDVPNPEQSDADQNGIGDLCE